MYSIVFYILELLLGRLSGYTAVVNQYVKVLEEAMQNNLDAYYELSRITWPQIGFTAALIILALSLMGMILSTGYQLFALNTARESGASYGNLFDPIGNFFRVLWLTLRMAIFIWLWSLLFIIPGIIAAYRYSMALFVLLENPETSPRDCMRRSRELTDGRKGELFVLDLSFLGWDLLATIPVVNLWVMPYRSLTLVHTYFELVRMHDRSGGYGGSYGGTGTPPWENGRL